MSTKPISYADFERRLLSLYAPPFRARSTYLGMRLVLRDFRAATGAATTADLTTDRVAAYVCSRAAANVNTTRSRLRYLKTASLFALNEGWLERPPQWSRLTPRASPPARKRHHAYEEVVRLLDDLRVKAGSGSGWKARRLYARPPWWPTRGSAATRPCSSAGRMSTSPRASWWSSRGGG